MLYFYGFCGVLKNSISPSADRNDIQLAGVQYTLDSVVAELQKDEKRRFIYVICKFLHLIFGSLHLSHDFMMHLGRNRIFLALVAATG